MAQMTEETMLCKCNECGKEEHVKIALYCTRCDVKLDLNNVATH